jgi:DNA (cytosine-5)-methyltransferase 1
MENVPHLHSFAESLVARAIQRNFEALGYCVYHELLEAGDYGVPQARRRLFFIGTRIGWVYRWPRATHGKRGRLPRPLTLADAIADLPLVPAPSLIEERPYCPRERLDLKVSSGYAQLMRSTMLSPQQGLLFDHVVRPVREDDTEIFRSMQPGGRYRDVDPRYRRYAIKKVGSDEYFADRYYRLCWAQPCVTITAHMAKDGYRHIYPDHDQLRTLSVREAARVQSFPDHFRFAGYRSSRFRQIGNAVPPLLARAIGDSIARRIREYQRGSLAEHVWQPSLPGLDRSLAVATVADI